MAMNKIPPKAERPTSYPGWDGTLPRRRATVLVARDGAVLLARDRGRSTYMLPGGGVEDGEIPIAAAARELYEETGLEATALRYLFTFPGKYNDHHVFAAETDGDAAAQGEIDSLIWWNEQDGDGGDTPIYPHVRGILDKAKESGGRRA